MRITFGNKQYYAYGNQKFTNTNYKEPEKNNKVKAYATLTFGIGCLALGMKKGKLWHY